jgi:predicted restriction endonuclease
MLTEKQKEVIIERRAGICEIATCFETKNLECHHIIRISQGGTDEPSNILVLCNHHHTLIHAKEDF